MNFSPPPPRTNAFRFASQFCFPRLSGTKGEKEAQELIKKNLQNLGLLPLEQEFQASYLPLNFSRFALFPMGLFILMGGIFYAFHSPRSSMLFFILALVLGLSFALYCQSIPRFLGWRKKHWSKNLFAKLGPENPEREILLVAHYDSKSQGFPAWLRVVIYYLGALFSLLVIGAGIYLSGALSPAPNFSPVWLGIFFSSALIDFFPLFNLLGNFSPGATDNAGAMGVVFELARIFQEHPPKRSRIWFLFPGAEELGLLGARAFLETHSAELDPRKTLVFNFDPLGSGAKISALSRVGFPGKKTDPELNQLFKIIADQNALPFHMLYFSVGFSTDAYPFLKKGYRTVNLGTFNRWIHTSQDTIDKLNPHNLDDYVRILQRLISDLDQK